ncbi:hypothetical protein [Curtobacterium oceanosedimentum]|uniref:hypothetical protein n=1 Tax=Curtobacterium oceanosedimentum TaxID=465820 RepID=UPI001CE09FBA|nr:hypothetical protein [Curtobacterium oceanosedimentum]MCA5923098.1 hypothetical protein [Curtobacterium oceanosedimentum]
MNVITAEKLNFDSELASAVVLREVVEFPITERTVVVNLAQTDAFTGTAQLGPLPPLSSTNLVSGTVTGELLLAITAHDVGDQEQQARAIGWQDFYGDGGPVLLKSPQDTIGTVTLDRRTVLHQPALDPQPEAFVVKANLWFSPAGTDCGIHNVHPFIEVHTQITGTGRMQKFDDKRHDTIYEDQQLSPGTTNPIPFCIDLDGEFTYPWHQYRADSDCIWLALEYHAS